MLRISHCLHNGLTDGGNIVSPTHRPRFAPQKQFFTASGTHFYERPSEPQGLVRAEGLGKLKNVTLLDLEPNNASQPHGPLQLLSMMT
jgi:hypothetical protein